MTADDAFRKSELLNVTNTKHRYVSAYATAGYTYDLNIV